MLLRYSNCILPIVWFQWYHCCRWTVNLLLLYYNYSSLTANFVKTKDLVDSFLLFFDVWTNIIYISKPVSSFLVFISRRSRFKWHFLHSVIFFFLPSFTEQYLYSSSRWLTTIRVRGQYTVLNSLAVKAFYKNDVWKK